MIAFRLDRLASLGLDIYISEFDIMTDWPAMKAPVNMMTPETQAQEVVKYIKLFYSHRAVRAACWSTCAQLHHNCWCLLLSRPVV